MPSAPTPQKAATETLLDSGRRVLTMAQEALNRAALALGADFVALCGEFLQTKGRVVVMGVGKSGHVGAKIAATLASTGTNAFFIHPTEAAHGDLGAVSEHDLILMLSKSGSSHELELLVPAFKRRGNRIVCMTCESESPLAQASDCVWVLEVEQEACPNNLAPTTSSTLMLAAGDAVAVALLEAKGFSRADFANFHPAGRLGRRLLMRVSDLMRTGDDMPLVEAQQPISEALLIVSQKRMGVAVIYSAVNHHQVEGLLTDGDLRRCLERNVAIHHTPICEVMTRDFHQISPQELAIVAFNLMDQHQINVLPVMEQGQIQGVLSLHDVIGAGVV
ncbi:MAG: KpsF/GutQ family sugar-phosphate isomerase [Gammaproteobacteria bacterium]